MPPTPPRSTIASARTCPPHRGTGGRSSGADIGRGLGLGLGDLDLGHLGAAGDELFDLRLGFDGHAGGVFLGAGDDALRFGFGGVAAPLVGIAGATSILPLGVVTVASLVLAALAFVFLVRPARVPQPIATSTITSIH